MQCSKCKEEKPEVKQGSRYCSICKTEYNRNWRKNNAGWHRERVKEWARNRRIKIIKHYGGKCVCCGEKNFAFLSIDHKNNDGYIERKQYPGESVYSLIIKKSYPKTYQILCYNCNHAKANLGICPHQRSK